MSFWTEPLWLEKLKITEDRPEGVTSGPQLG